MAIATLIAAGRLSDSLLDRAIGLLRELDPATSFAGWIDEVIAEHPDEAKRYMSGEKKLQGVLVGFVMKKSGGKADPKRVNQLLMSRAGGG